ncbi:MAG TPA: hypothetical protein VFO38_05990 [Candidatus Saccharimonadales bacterium]|nr:hypothetical protein [Candidatus Saccharimonadales bacterium]
MLDSNVLAALRAIGSSLPPGGDEKTFAEVQADSDREARTLQALSDRLKKAMDSYELIKAQLDGVQPGSKAAECLDRPALLAQLEAAPFQMAFVEEFEAELKKLRDELEEVEEAEGTSYDRGHRRHR